MIPYSEAHFVGDRRGGVLRSVVSGASAPVKFSEDHGESRLDGFDSRGDDLHILVRGFIGDIRVLEFLNRCIAQRFDLPSRIVAVKFGEMQKGLSQGEGQPSDAAGGVLTTVGFAHFIISRPVWLSWRADHAAAVVRREAREAA